MIFLTGNAFQLFLTRMDQEALLRQVHRQLHDEGLFAYLETWNAEEIDPSYTDSQGRQVLVPEPRSMTMSHKSCSGRVIGAGKRTVRSRRISRAWRYAILSLRSWKRYYTTMVFRESAAMAIRMVRL